MPYVVAGGGGMPKAEPANHAVAMTMNVAISESAWRVRWQNLGSGDVTNVKVKIRAKCSNDESVWGK